MIGGESAEIGARNYLVGERPDAILNIVDGTNIERNLYLTTQILELGIPTVIALNMIFVEFNSSFSSVCEMLARSLCEYE